MPLKKLPYYLDYNVLNLKLSVFNISTAQNFVVLVSVLVAPLCV